MRKRSHTHGHFPRHQEPLIVIGIFLAIALGAMILILANNTSEDTGSGGTPGGSLQTNDCPRGTPEGFELSDVEGKTLSEVESWAAGEGMTVRVVVRDGQPLPTTMDYNADRINTQVEADVVTRYCGNF